MKCPHCNYEHGWSGEHLDMIDGQKGDLYKLPVMMERESLTYHRYKEPAYLYGCPSCKKTFIEKS